MVADVEATASKSGNKGQRMLPTAAAKVAIERDGRPMMVGLRLSEVGVGSIIASALRRISNIRRPTIVWFHLSTTNEKQMEVYGFLR